MPRDLGLEGHDFDAVSSYDLSLHPEASLGIHAADSHNDDDFEEMLAEEGVLNHIDVVGQATEIVKQLHPYAQVLGLADVNSCVKLEDAAFKEGHRATREKFVYRLTRCSELSLGLFTSAGPDSPEHQATTASTANPPDSNDPERKTILLAHIVATKSENDRVTDDDMAIPPDWQDKARAGTQQGHKEHGRTLMVHSLAVLPAFQRKGLGSILLKAYIQRMVEADAADRMALVTYDKLIPFYESLGFSNTGRSKVKFGGAEWYDMVLKFDDIRPDTNADDDGDIDE